MRMGLRAGSFLWGLLLTLPHAWADMTPAQAFEAGKTFGQSPQGAAAVKESISGANASAQVPHYDTSNAQSALYEGGNGDPRTPGGNRVTECATAHYADARQQVECDAINDLANNRAARPPLAIVPADPILVKGAAVKSDPAAVAGAFGGAYGECKTTSVTRPATYEEAVCNEYKTLSDQVCQKTLSVTVKTDSLCVTGTYEYPHLFSTDDVGGEDWRIDSLCAGGTIRVQCWSGGYQNTSFVVPLNATGTIPVYGTTCYPHTHHPYRKHRFYYANPQCDATTKLCTVTVYDVPDWDPDSFFVSGDAWDPYLYACPSGQTDGSDIQSCDGDGNCSTLTRNRCYQQQCGSSGFGWSCDWVDVGAATITGIRSFRSWTQTFHSEGETYSFEDTWDDQCALLETRTQ